MFTGKTKAILAKLLDREERPRPPPKPTDPPTEAFNNLSLKPSHRPSHERRQNKSHSPPLPSRPAAHPPSRSTNHRRQSHDDLPTDFVGGFQPLPKPPAMPLPQPAVSMTMQHALRPAAPTPTPSGLNVPHTPHRPHSAPEAQQQHIPVPTHVPFFCSPQPHQQHSAYSPPKQGRKRASSTPPDPSTPLESQCAGITKVGKRCARQVKNGGLAYPGVDRFCFQHTKDLLTPTGFYTRPKGGRSSEWIEFADYIPEYLHPDTQVALRVEMEKLRSSSDVEGYIYTFEIRDVDATSKTVQLKVGRTTNVVKRLNEWGKQCGSKEQVLRGWYPGAVGEDESLMKGRVILPDGGNEDVWCHRLERLIHLELADLAANAAYLESGWRAFTKGRGRGKFNRAKVDLPASPPQKKRGGGTGLGNGGNGKRCEDCGTLHKEIFEFRRVTSGPYKGREWEGIVKKVVEEWGQFVRIYV